MRRKSSGLNNSRSDNKVKIIRSGAGSFDFVRTHKSKGIFYCVDDETGVITLLDNMIKNKEVSFNSFDDFAKYVEENYN